LTGATYGAVVIPANNKLVRKSGRENTPAYFVAVPVMKIPLKPMGLLY
jgi:hypothetical protein